MTLQRIGRSEAEEDGAPFTPAFDFDYASSLKASYAATRARLYGAGSKYPVRAKPDENRKRPSYRIVAREPFGPSRGPYDAWKRYLARVTEEYFAATAKVFIKDIIAEVAAEHGFTITDIHSKSQRAPLARCRQEIFYRCANETTASYPMIGRALEKDHTTVIHGIRKHAELNYLKLPRGMKWPHQTESFRLSRIGVGA